MFNRYVHLCEEASYQKDKQTPTPISYFFYWHRGRTVKTSIWWGNRVRNNRKEGKKKRIQECVLGSKSWKQEGVGVNASLLG